MKAGFLQLADTTFSARVGMVRPWCMLTHRKRTGSTLVSSHEHTSSAAQDPALKSPSNLNYFPTAKAPTLGVRTSAREPGGREHTQSTTPVPNPSLPLADGDRKEDWPYLLSLKMR